MARISDTLIESLKQSVSLIRLAENQGHELARKGQDHVMTCPFHDDDTPSLVISPNNLFHCFGCGAAGSVIDWVMKTQGVSFRHAVELLQDRSPLAASSDSDRPPKRGTVKQLSAPLAADADDQAALSQVIDYYHATLKQSPEALDYLKQRGLQHPELIDHFKLGYANRTLGYRLPDKNRKAGKALREKLQSIGLIRNSGHEHFNGSLIIPVMDGHGVISEVYGRKLLNNLRKGTPKHLYLPGAHRGVWNVAAFAAMDEIILCEALLDAMTFWVNGFRNVTTSYGTSGFTDDHLAAFKDHDIKRVLIAYDRDEAGNHAADELAKKLNNEGIDTFRVLFPKGMDANSYALNVQPAAKSLGLALRKAEWMGTGQAPVLRTGADPLEQLDPVQPEPIEVETMAAKDETLVDPDTIPPLAADLEPEQRDHELLLTFGDRKYRIRGLAKNTSYDQLKMNVLVRLNDRFHVDTLDLYAARQRAGYVKQASSELGVEEDIIKRDLGQVLLKLETLQDEQIQSALTPQTTQVELTAEDKAEALSFLKSPNLLEQLLTDFDAAGVVGEATNKLVGYLACVSRKLDKPLAIVIQSASAAGKSSLLDAVLAFMPPEDRVQYSAMTGQSLFYMGEMDLKHKILAIAEDAGAEHAAYALKLLQSEGEITIASTGKDPSTGNLKTQTYRVEGPVMLCLTTTAIDVDEELLNRCLVLTVNETRAQTQAIHDWQRKRETLEGLLTDATKAQVLNKHQNAQRLLTPRLVANPYAEQLTFLDDKTRTRRDHVKYLTLIRAIALLHQYQRPVKTVLHNGQHLEYIEVTLDDIDMANRLAHEVLGRTLDELPPQTRTLLKKLHAWVTEVTTKQAITRRDFRFSRRDVREATGWGNTQLKVHLKRLEDMEYLLIHRGGRGQAFVYELLYEGEGTGEQPFMMGLSSPESDLEANRSEGSRGLVGVQSAPGRKGQSTANAAIPNGCAEPDQSTEKTLITSKNAGASYVPSSLAAAAE